MKLTKAQWAVLERLARRDIHLDGCPSGRELSRMMGHRLKDWASSRLRALEKLGYVQRMGKTFTNGQCWAATPAGHAALARDTEQSR